MYALVFTAKHACICITFENKSETETAYSLSGEISDKKAGIWVKKRQVVGKPIAATAAFIE